MALEKWLSSLDLDKNVINELVLLTNLRMQQNVCSFRNKFFKMEDGLAMGNPLSPFLANLYMGQFEMHITKSFPHMFKSWFRFVDDIFAIVDKNLIDDSLKLLNLQDKSIKFTLETENSGSIPFLDLRIMRKDNKLEFGIYRKPTHVDNYIKNLSYNPRQHKHAILNSLTYRLVNIPLSKMEYEKELTHIIQVAYDNGFNKN